MQPFPPRQRPGAPRPQLPQQPARAVPSFVAFNVRAVENGGALKAYVSVKIGPEFVLHDFRVIEQPGGEGRPRQAPWVSVPMRTWQEPTGERRYSALAEIPAAWKASLFSAVLEKWREETARQQEGAGR